MANAERALDALGDRTRRGVLKRLRHDSRSVRQVDGQEDVTEIGAGAIDDALSSAYPAESD